MQPSPLAASAAQPRLRAWLPAKPHLAIKSRLFSKNIFYSRDLFARATATCTSTCVFACLLACLLAFVVYILLLWLAVAHASSRQTIPLCKLSTINPLHNQLDSDEYQHQHQSTRSTRFLPNLNQTHALRTMLATNQHALPKRSSIVRITSSDPTSSLFQNPIHIHLEHTTRRSFCPAPASNTPASDSSTPNNPRIPSPTLNPIAQNSSSPSGSPTPSAATRRKQSATLIPPENARRQHTASPSRSPLTSSQSLPTRPTRARSADARSPRARTAVRNKRNTTSSQPSPHGASSNAEPKFPPPCNLPNQHACTDQPPTTALPAASHDEHVPATPSIPSASIYTSAFHHNHHQAPTNSSACLSPAHSTSSTSRVLPILKLRPQPFRTASLREIDFSYCLMQRRASLPTFPMFGPVAAPALQQQQQQHQHQQLLQPNPNFIPFTSSSPAPSPYQPSNPDVASAQQESRASSTLPKTRSIKLVEPDWRPHIDSHLRARERLETASRFAASKMATTAQANAHASADTRYDQPNVNVDEFWFERFAHSTAAAGSDWDWRKRSARLQRAAALGMALGQSGLASQAASNPPTNVGKTHVQLHHQQGVQVSTPAAQAASPVPNTLLAAPLISFTEQELQSTPVLKIDTQTAPTAKRDTNLSPTPSRTATPLGGIFGAVVPSSVTVAARIAQRRRASQDSSASSPSVLDASPFREVSSSPLPTTTQSHTSDNPESGPSSDSAMSSSFSVPGRLSSLGETVGKKVGLRNLRSGLRRGSGGNDFLSDSTGMELVPNSPNFEQVGDEPRTGASLDEKSSPELPRSSADAYSYSNRASEDGTPQRILSRTNPALRRAAGDQNDSMLSQPRSKLDAQPKSAQPSFHGGASFARQNSAPTPVSSMHSQHERLEKLQNDWERVCGSADSCSDSLRRRMRSRSHTGSFAASDAMLGTRNNLNTARNEALAALFAGGTASSPPVVKSRARTASRSSIMRSASGARTDLGQRHSSLRHNLSSSETSSISSSAAGPGSRNGSHNGSVRHGSPKQSRKELAAPDPQMQPEPAPRGMAQRARSASISSTSSSLASSRSGSRKNSFRDAQPVGMGGVGFEHDQQQCGYAG